MGVLQATLSSREDYSLLSDTVFDLQKMLDDLLGKI
jgi:hypothetical protein